MILIADSGSTKTSWCLVNEKTGNRTGFSTSGINPYLQSESEIYGTLSRELPAMATPFRTVHFYCAGCGNESKTGQVRRALSNLLMTKDIMVYPDILAAARSLCGSRPGIAAILGTGSNSCYYDGEKITDQISPLGYILGDEGSGAILGRTLISSIMKRELPPEIGRLFFEKYNLTRDEIMERVYDKPFPNRFLAQFTFFLSDNIDHPSIRKMVRLCFNDFFTKNIKPYEKHNEQVNFTGGVAWNFRKILIDSARETGFSTGKITPSPIEDLVSFHLEKMKQ